MVIYQCRVRVRRTVSSRRSPGKSQLITDAPVVFDLVFDPLKDQATSTAARVRCSRCTEPRSTVQYCGYCIHTRLDRMHYDSSICGLVGPLSALKRK
jgi:hypothetical protein